MLHGFRRRPEVRGLGLFGGPVGVFFLCVLALFSPAGVQARQEPSREPRTIQEIDGQNGDGAFERPVVRSGAPLARQPTDRQAFRRGVLNHAQERGITPQDFAAMSPQERADLVREYRAQMAATRTPQWRQRMVERRLRARDLESGDRGFRHVRAQIIATDADPAVIARALANGYRELRRVRFEGLGVSMVVLAPPPGENAQRAMQRLRAADPRGSYDLNHVFDPSSAQTTTARGFAPGATFDGRGAKIGIVDTGIDKGHPALLRARIISRQFTGADQAGMTAASAAQVGAESSAETGHGTAVAALLVGEDRGFSGVIPGASVFVADVFGASETGGSAEAIAAGLAWLDSQNVDVINVSLEGPPNQLLEVVVRALVRKGRTVVAAVGNEGPTKPVAFPAAYEGVIGVTAIDIERRVYIFANRGPEVDFSALGVNILTAGDGRSYETVTGTSFAAPLIAAALAAPSRSLPSLSARVDALAKVAVDLGAPGRDPVYGAGALDFTASR